MDNKIVTALLAILLALGGWNLSQTFKLSNDMVLVKEKISNIEDKINKFKPNKKKKKNKQYSYFLKKRRWYSRRR